MVGLALNTPESATSGDGKVTLGGSTVLSMMRMKRRVDPLLGMPVLRGLVTLMS